MMLVAQLLITAASLDDLLAPYAEPTGPSVSALVLRDGQRIARASVGPATENTHYRLASVTKHMTAALILTLVDQGKLTLDTPLRDLWPELPEGVTVRHVLHHRSGLVDYEDHLPPGDAQVHDDDVLAILRKQPKTLFAPGSQFAYSNSGYVLLAQIYEKVTQKSFAESVSRLTGCVAHVAGRTLVPYRAYGYTKVEGCWTVTDQSRTSATLGDGGVYCSLESLEKWLTSGKAQQPRMLEPVGEYGFGWFIKGNRVWHTGTTIGFRNAIVREGPFTVVVLANRSDVKAEDLANQILRAYAKN